MNNFLLAIAGLIISVFAAAFAIPYFVNWNDYRPEIESQISSLIGREMKVDGGIEMRLLPRPFIRLQKVRVLDTFPGSKKPFIEIEKFTLWLSAPALLSGQISAQKLKLMNPVINLVVDGRGRGNWEEFNKKNTVQSGVNIQDIKLQDVAIEKGRIIVHSLVDKGNEIFKTPAVSGALSAPSLSGPYKFKGHLETKSGARNTLNFSTGRHDKVKGMRVTAFLQNALKNATYRVDSVIKAENGGKLSYQGKMIAKIPFESLFKAAKTLATPRKDKTKEPLEIVADLDGTATRAKLKNITFSLVRKNRPQALKGAVQLDWSQGDLQAVGSFNARSLDFDLMGSDVGEKFNVSRLLADLPQHIYDFGNVFHRADFVVQLEQIQVGGEMIRNLEGVLQKTLTELTISNLTAKLPAASYLSLSGKIEKEATKSVTFSGPLLIQGQNVGRFQNWIMSQKEKDSLNKPFIFASEVIAGKGQVKFTDIDADLAGNVIGGEVHQHSENNEPLIVKLDLVNLNIAELFGEEISLKSLVQKQGNAEDDRFRLPLLQNMSLADLEQQKAKISIRVGQLTLTDTVLNDFRIQLDFGQKNKRLKEFSFISKEGLKVVLDGALPSKQMPVGHKLNLRIETLQPTAISQLLQLLDLDSSFDENDERFELIHPVGLTIGLEREAGVKGYRLLLNGQAKESEIFAYGYMGVSDQAKQDKGVVAHSHLDLKISLSNPDGKSLLKQFVTDLSPENLADIGKGKGSLNIQLVGVPEKGMQTEIFGALPGLKMTALGNIKVADGQKHFSGPIHLEAKNMSQGLSLLGLGIQVRPDAGALSLKGNLVKTGTLYGLTNIVGKIGDSDIYGTAQLDNKAKQPKLNLSLTSQTASLVSILEPTIDWFGKEKTQGVKSEGLWTNKRFDLALLKGFKGTLELKSKEMEIDQGLILKDAVLTAQYGDGQFVVDELSGKAFGGMVQSAFRVKHGRAASAVVGSIQMSNVDLKQLFGEKADVLATGKANLSLDYTGRGLSPKGMLNLMIGKGTLELIDTQFNYLSPSALQDMAQEDKIAKNDKSQSFEQRFEGYLAAGQFNAGSRKFDLKIADGIVRFDTGKMTDDDVHLSVKSYLSLANLGLDSEWRLKAGAKIKPKNMPAVVLQFAGKLANLGALKPVYKLKSLQSFLSVLKIEQDVDRLEALNSKLEKAAQEDQKARAGNQKARAGNQIQQADKLDQSSTVEVSPIDNLPNLMQPSVGVQVTPLNDL